MATAGAIWLGLDSAANMLITPIRKPVSPTGNAASATSLHSEGLNLTTAATDNMLPATKTRLLASRTDSSVIKDL